MKLSTSILAFIAALPLTGLAQQQKAASTEKVMKAIEQTMK